jgi:hypothetical protein
MFDTLASPSTLLCLGVVFLLVSLLFFYFKRTTMLLEKAQMEQARILQAFISNMEMSRNTILHGSSPYTAIHSNSNIKAHHEFTDVRDSNNELIDVSDDDNDDEDSEDDSEDDSDEDSDDDSESTSNKHAAIYPEHTHLGLHPDISTLPHSNSTIEDVSIKVIQLQDHDLEELKNINIDISDDDVTDSDDDMDTSVVELEPLHEEPSVNNNNMKNGATMNDTKHITNLSIDIKSLNVQALRQMAIDRHLIQKGDKSSKKDLIKLLENTDK